MKTVKALIPAALQVWKLREPELRIGVKIPLLSGILGRPYKTGLTRLGVKFIWEKALTDV